MFMKTRRLKSQQLAHMRWQNLPPQVETQSPLRLAQYELRATSQLSVQFKLPFKVTCDCPPP